MEETRWWSKLFVVSAAISLILLITSPFGYKYGVFDLQTSFGSLMLALVSAAIVLVASLIMLVVTIRNALVKNRNLVVCSIVLSLVPILVMAPQINKGRSVPPIHDISTDTVSPPSFQKVISLRSETDNSLVYELEGSADNLAKAQMGAYPQLASIESALSVADAVDRTRVVLEQQGLEIVNSDVEQGIVEATATTFWFGFKDDVVVRVKSSGAGSILDLRSASRVGQSDVGVNAARIMAFSAAF